MFCDLENCLNMGVFGGKKSFQLGLISKNALFRVFREQFSHPGTNYNGYKQLNCIFNVHEFPN